MQFLLVDIQHHCIYVEGLLPDTVDALLASYPQDLTGYTYYYGLNNWPIRKPFLAVGQQLSESL